MVQFKQQSLSRTGIIVVEVGASSQVPVVNANFLLLNVSAFGGLVKDKDLTTPPALTGSGNGYIIPSGATGAWSGKAKYQAYDFGSWILYPPAKGQRVKVEDEGVRYEYDGTNWVLEVASSTLAEVRTWVTKTASFTPSTSEAARYLIDASSGNVAVSLPAAAGVANTGWIFKRLDATFNSHTVLFTANGSELIDHLHTPPFSLDPDVAIELSSNGTQWLLT